jgi:hypothetical protein
LFGENPLYYNLSAYVFRLLIGFWAFLAPDGSCGRARMPSVFGASLLYLIYPGFLSQHNGIDYQPQMVSLAAAMLSLALERESRMDGTRLAKVCILFTLSTLLGWLYLSLVEYFIGFELFRWGCVFLLSVAQWAGRWPGRHLACRPSGLPVPRGAGRVFDLASFLLPK